MDRFINILRPTLKVVSADVLDSVTLVPPKVVLYYELAGLYCHISVVITSYLFIMCAHRFFSFAHSFGIVDIAHLNECFSAQSV